MYCIVFNREDRGYQTLPIWKREIPNIQNAKEIKVFIKYGVTLKKVYKGTGHERSGKIEYQFL